MTLSRNGATIQEMKAAYELYKQAELIVDELGATPANTTSVEKEKPK